jgi:hypothetical protein
MSCLFALPVGVTLLDQLIVEATPSICTAETILGVTLCDKITVVEIILLFVVWAFVKLAVMLPAGLLT